MVGGRRESEAETPKGRILLRTPESVRIGTIHGYGRSICFGNGDKANCMAPLHARKSAAFSLEAKKIGSSSNYNIRPDQ
jgi:hypothetical protein